MCLSAETIERLDVSCLTDISTDLNSAVSIQEIARTVGIVLQEKLHLHACCVVYKESPTTAASTVWFSPGDKGEFCGLDDCDGPITRVFKNGRAEVVCADEADARLKDLETTLETSSDTSPQDISANNSIKFYSPLKAAGRVHGVVGLGRKDSKPFAKGEDAFISLVTNMAGSAIQRVVAETKLSRKEALYKTALEKTRDIMLVLDRNGMVSFESPSARSVIGVSLMESMDREFLTHIHPRDAERVGKLLGAASEGCSTATRLRLRCRDDWQEFDVRFSPSGIQTDDNSIIADIREISATAPVNLDAERAGLESAANEKARVTFEAKSRERLAVEMAVVKASATMLSNDFDRAVEKVLEEVGGAIGAKRTSLYLIDTNCQGTEDSWHWLSNGSAVPGAGIPRPNESEMPWMFSQFKDGQSVVIKATNDLPEAASREKALLEEIGVTSAIWLPLKVEGALAGVMCVDNPVRDKDWGGGDLQLLEMVPNLINSALSRRRILDELLEGRESQGKTLTSLRKALEGTIQAMVRTVETRDPYTAGHQRRVSNLGRTIAAKIGLTDDRIDAVRLAGSLHDLGKIGVPAEILSRPGVLTDPEFELIKGHSHIGYNILKDIDFPWPVADIVRQHHERLDGSGYPSGLKGEDIMMEARILSVADVVEAMATHRPYRPALGVKAALDEIRSGSGTKYDPVVTSACLHLIENEGFQL
jgi:PAS domain S-box-containing protein